MTELKIESKIKALYPQKDDIVNIKFKNINDIIKDSTCEFHDTEEKYAIADNVKAYLTGGHFVVKKFKADKEYEDGLILVVANHLDCNYSFRIYENTIESIEIVNDSEKWVSTDHRLMVVRVDSELFINGQPLIWNESQEKKEHEMCITKRGADADEYDSHNRKLLKLLENYIADLAVRETFSQKGEA